MAKRIKKPTVKQEQRWDWLKRFEQGESPPQIAKQDKYDVRTIRTHIEKARQERDVKEARSIVLRNALELHYKDLCDYAEKLSSKVSGQAVSWSPRDEHLQLALRQHLPRSPVWRYLKIWEDLVLQADQLRNEINVRLEKGVRSDQELLKAVSGTETGVISGIIGALIFQAQEWAQGRKGLDLKENLVREPADENFTNLQYGFSQLGKVSLNHVVPIREAIRKWETKVKKWVEFENMKKTCSSLERVSRELRHELAVIVLRRVVPSRCEYCPL